MKTEEIIKAAQTYYPSGILHEEAKVVAFVRGAKWADKTMLDLACEWLKENIDLYAFEGISIKSGFTEIKLTDEFETAFRQAMEGGVE